jgi:hypothetical protein
MTEKKFTEEGHLIKEKKKGIAESGSETALPKDISCVDTCCWELPKTHKEGMRVPARIYANKVLIEQMDKGVFDQVTNVASLPGIQKYAYCMPDGHI